MTRVFTTNIEKGGVGKTTITFNGAFYLTEKEQKRVLLIDLDKSMNLTNRFANYVQEPIQDEHTVKAFFEGTGNPNPIKLTERLDLIAGYRHLPELTKDIEAGKGRGYMLSWYFANLEAIEATYDYILIDTHNDHSIFTDNAIAMSDLVIAIADIDEDAIKKLQEEDEHVDILKAAFVNPMTNESFVTAKVIKVGNKVQKNTGDSHEFRKAFEHLMSIDPSFLGYFEFRAPFAKAKTSRLPLVELEEDYNKVSDRKFFEDSYGLFKKLYHFGEGE